MTSVWVILLATGSGDGAVHMIKQHDANADGTNAKDQEAKGALPRRLRVSIV